MTVARQYSDRPNDIVLDTEKLMAIMQEELRKRNFEGFGTLAAAFRHLDKEWYVKLLNPPPGFTSLFYLLN